MLVLGETSEFRSLNSEITMPNLECWKSNAGCWKGCVGGEHGGLDCGARKSGAEKGLKRGSEVCSTWNFQEVLALFVCLEILLLTWKLFMVKFHETWGGIPRMECLCCCFPPAPFRLKTGFMACFRELWNLSVPTLIRHRYYKIQELNRYANPKSIYYEHSSVSSAFIHSRCSASFIS